MARIDIKGILNLRDALHDSAIAYADANRKIPKKGSAASKSLRIAEAQDASRRLVEDAIDLVSALATADTGLTGELARKLRTLTREAPYAAVFAAAEKAAAKR